MSLKQVWCCVILLSCILCIINSSLLKCKMLWPIIVHLGMAVFPLSILGWANLYTSHYSLVPNPWILGSEISWMNKKSTFCLKGPFCDPNMRFLRHSSVDILEINLFPNFQSILNLRLWVIHVLLNHTVT